MIKPNIDIVIDCHDLEAQLDFWSAALGYRKSASRTTTDCSFRASGPTRL